MAKNKKITVEIIPGDYCECGCKGQCDTREVLITKNGKTTTIGYEADLEELLEELSKKKYFKFEITI